MGTLSFKDDNSMFDAIMRAEGTNTKDPYNTVLGYGAYGTPDRNLTDMSLDEVDAFGESMRKNPKNPFNSSAVGAFQIVGTTRRAAAKALGYDGNTKYTPEVQQNMAKWIHKTQGLGAWEGFKRNGGRGSGGGQYAANAPTQAPSPASPWYQSPVATRAQNYTAPGQAPAAFGATNYGMGDMSQPPTMNQPPVGGGPRKRKSFLASLGDTLGNINPLFGALNVLFQKKDKPEEAII